MFSPVLNVQKIIKKSIYRDSGIAFFVDRMDYNKLLTISQRSFLCFAYFSVSPYSFFYNIISDTKYYYWNDHKECEGMVSIKQN